MRTGKRTRRRARRRKQIAGACIVILLILLILGLAGILLWRNIKISQRKSDSGKDAVTEQEMTQENKTETITEIQTEAVTEPPVSLGISAEDLYSANAFLVRTKTGETLLDKGSAEQIYPASMTKVMTAVVILENISDLQAEVRLSEEMFDELYRQEASLAGFLPGETVTARDLLYGVMLPSGAECCTGLADYIAGSEEGFADLMNRKAAELGMENTHFVNASGLHDPGHYTTAADMAKLMEYALRNDTFKEIASSAWHSTEPTDMHPDGITVYNTLFGSMTEEIRDSGIITGGKTGYTGEAGLCLASFAEINGETFILVTAGADGNHETEQFHVLDAYAVYRAIKF
ncbi:MAG: D-alanyl-D-alanine carboxypeptidase [Lachnospiraceae bacterium]|nr:D-alanyl-D-alanine carboxypeptidase [Lachnospiraceae bacterium]MCI9661163.1 D-alanyl-D-alanine carboxypeptidase [Lachnospiraceae bacterium]